MAVYTSNRVMRMLYNIKRKETAGELEPLQLPNTMPFGDDKAANAFNFLIGSGIGAGVHLVPSPADADDVAVGSKRKAGGGAGAKGTKRIKRELKEATDSDYEGIKACLQDLLRTVGDPRSIVHSFEKSIKFDGLYVNLRNDGERICLNQRNVLTTHVNNNSALLLLLKGDLEYNVVCVPYPIICSRFWHASLGWPDDHAQVPVPLRRLRQEERKNRYRRVSVRRLESDTTLHVCPSPVSLCVALIYIALLRRAACVV